VTQPIEDYSKAELAAIMDARYEVIAGLGEPA
jgi:hypothetical protein